jgi:hypothetical protein
MMQAMSRPAMVPGATLLRCIDAVPHCRDKCLQPPSG